MTVALLLSPRNNLAQSQHPCQSTQPPLPRPFQSSNQQTKIQSLQSCDSQVQQSRANSCSHFQQTAIHPLQALQSQQQVVTPSNQRFIPQRQEHSHVWDQDPQSQNQASATQPIVDQLPPLPPQSCFNSISNGGDEEVSYRAGDEKVTLRLAFHYNIFILPQVGVNYDVLKHHRVTNCHPQSPSPTSMMSAANRQAHQLPQRHSSPPMQPNGGSVVELEGDAEDHPCRHGKYSKHSKDSIVPKPFLLAFYPPLWRKLLDLAKARMWLHIAVENAFPWLEQAVDRICCEVLIEVIAHFEDKGWEVEAGDILLFSFIGSF